MIEVLDIAPREMKGTSANGKNYHFYIQKAKVTSVDRDGIETSDVVEVQTDPGDVYEPASDYVIDPRSCYVGTYQDAKQRTRKRIQIGNSVRLVRLSKLANDFAKPALKAA
jgi:hypothetical protein